MAYDLIVVGSRVAGASTAMLAARRGLSVLLVDKCKFPSDTLSTNYIHQPGVKRLDKWGVLDRVIQSGCPAIPTTRFQYKDYVIKGGVSDDYSHINAYAPRRFILDTILIECARDLGVEVREQCNAGTILWQNDRVIGIEITDKHGVTKQEHCRLLVGADGMNSTVAKNLEAPFIIKHERLTCAYYTFWENIGHSYELYEGDSRWVGAVPTNDCTLVATYFPQYLFDTVRRSPLKHHLQAINDVAAPLANRLKSGHQIGKLWGTGHQKNFFRQATGAGWALVGDAGHHKDSITARGITDAMVQAELFVNAIADRIHQTDSTFDLALNQYAEDRTKIMMPGYLGTLAVAQLENQSQRNTLIDAVSSRPELRPLYFDVVAGIRPADTLIKQIQADVAYS